MLGGYAIETLPKMVIIADYRDREGFLLDSQKAKDFLPTSHALAELVQNAKLRTNKADRNLLTELPQYTMWAGRYPIPLMPPHCWQFLIRDRGAPNQKSTQHGSNIFG